MIDIGIVVFHQICFKVYESFVFTFPANRVVPSPSRATRAKEAFSDEASAMKPITGGPTRNPRKLMVETAASAALADIEEDFPARP